MTGEVASGNPLELGTILKRSRATFEVYAEPEVAQGQQSSNEKEQVSLEPPKKKRAGKPKYADTPYASSLITLSKTTGREIERMPMLTVALKKFELFAELPAEVRAAIWKILSDRSQQIRRVDTIVHRGPSGEKHAGYRMSGNLPPAVLRATKESRNEALRRFSLVHSFLPSDSTTFPDPKMIYVNFYVDSIYVAGMLSYPTLLSYFSKLGSDAMTQNPTINHPSELIRDLAFSSVQSSELVSASLLLEKFKSLMYHTCADRKCSILSPSRLQKWQPHISIIRHPAESKENKVYLYHHLQ